MLLFFECYMSNKLKLYGVKYIAVCFTSFFIMYYFSHIYTIKVLSSTHLYSGFNSFISLASLKRAKSFSLHSSIISISVLNNFIFSKKFIKSCGLIKSECFLSFSPFLGEESEV